MRRPWKRVLWSTVKVVVATGALAVALLAEDHAEVAAAMLEEAESPPG